MALLEELIITGGGEPILGVGNAFDKVNETIRTVNKIAGGETGEVPIKASDDDFDFEFYDLSLKADKDQGSWTNLSLNGAIVADGAVAPSYRKDQFGNIQFRGSYHIPYNNSVEHFTMPSGSRTDREVFFFVGRSSATPTTTVQLSFATNGEVDMLVPASVVSGNIEINLEGLIYRPNA